MNRLAHEIDDNIPGADDDSIEQFDIEAHALPQKKARTRSIGDNSKSLNAEVYSQHIATLEAIGSELRAVKKREKEAYTKLKADGFKINVTRKVIKERLSDEPELITQFNMDVRICHQLAGSAKVLYEGDQATLDLGLIGPEAKEERNEFKPIEQNPTSPSLAGRKLKKGQTGKVSAAFNKNKR